MAEFCSNCGSRVEANDSFCDECGAGLHAGAPAASAARSSGQSRFQFLASNTAVWAGLAAVVLLSAIAAAGYFVFLGGRQSLPDMVERISASVVSIDADKPVKAQDGGAQDQSQSDVKLPATKRVKGSGFAIAEDGLIVTCDHVISDAASITVTLSDGTRLDAKTVGRDPRTDLALLKINAKQRIEPLRFGDSEKLRIGDPVVAIGSPFGLGGSVASAMVAGRDRNIGVGPYDQFIQIDTTLHPHNFGGPLLNVNGEIIGVNAALVADKDRQNETGISFSIPSNLAAAIIDQLRQHGRVRRGWLGVQIQSVTDQQAKDWGMSKAQGALVATVTDSGPAARAGVEVGDVISKFAGKTVFKMRDLPRMVAQTSPGTTVDVELNRRGESRSLRIIMGELD